MRPVHIFFYVCFVRHTRIFNLCVMNLLEKLTNSTNEVMCAQIKSNEQTFALSIDNDDWVDVPDRRCGAFPLVGLSVVPVDLFQ